MICWEFARPSVGLAHRSTVVVESTDYPSIEGRESASARESQNRALEKVVST